MSIDEDYYEPIIVRSAFDGNYIQYESRGDKGKILSIKRYLKIIKPYLIDMIIKYKTHGLVRYRSGNKSWLEETSSEWKIQLTMAIKFTSSKDSDETRTMYAESKNGEIMIGSKTDEVEDLFEYFFQKYQEGLEESMRGSEYVYDSVDVLYYNLNKVSLSRGGSYIDSPKWLKNKKATINPQNKKDDKCFQYAVTVALNHEQIKDHPERISKIKLFIDQYNWNEIDFPLHGKDWKNFKAIK